MGLPVLILGFSGSGKSSSMRNFKPDELALVNVNGKFLPFRGGFAETLNSDDFEKIKSFMSSAKAKAVVVDDSQYLMLNEFMRRNSLFVKYPVVFSAGICRLNQCVHESKHGEVDINAAIDRCKIAKSTLKGTHFSSIAFYDGSIRDRALREKDYESIMPGALQRHEFQCYLQPKYGLRSRNIEGAEALIRWNSPDFGFISPGDFKKSAAACAAG